jgi:Glycosyltransferases involved in cell wall biogenesis
MSSKPGISLVIPCYNESDRVELLYDGVGAFLAQWPAACEVVIVNDGSSDDTLQKLQQHTVYQQYQNIIKIIDQKNTGKGGALKKGVMNATCDWVLTLDADMAAQPTEVIRWMEAVNWAPDTNTVYIGSREHRQSHIINEKANRKLAGSVFNGIVRSLTPLKVDDSQCGFKLYSNAMGKKLFGALRTYGWAHDVEILYRAQLSGATVKEMPLVWQAIEGSKIRLLRDSMKMFWEILKIRFIVKK